ncbi:wax ester/triacylglycerol synthase family O-acyltransferase [Geodermatophilus sp. DSM 44513]|uniref:WS/DGAT/MGAT family O-acyltransferase n=1 Tax=Geodermatophilus sp. DSM 44513 TaxID=1528104 RepID=UPI001273E80A|nr:wax ester/triacylglycerol synthase family O-acyltransferase [Geodermatophilus sp. DSM 44513]WNV74733.1 wax ester/triacylglycerol synthase family O-acyltransferase [Geodermatophilus sp. DSM 44513]
MEHLSTLDASFLHLEDPHTPMHVAGVLVLEAPAGGLDAIAALVAARLPLVPRYRQRVLEVPGHLATPVWADDPDFAIDHHVRRSALPRPGTHDQLLELVSRVIARPLDRSRPLWELYLVEGLAQGRAAVVTKTHPALVDGLGTMDIGQVLLDDSPDAPVPEPVPWLTRPLPSAVQLVGEAVGGYVTRPSAVVETARHAATDVRATGARLTGAAGGAVRAARSALFAAPRTPLNAAGGSQRRVVVARGDLDDVKRVRKAHGGTVNDVLLTVVTGALREWLLSRGQAVVGSTSVRALVPVSVHDAEEAPGTRVSGHLVDLPVGEPNPRLRLARLSYAMLGASRHGRSVGAEALLALTGFAPPTLHALGARAARGLSRRVANLVVTNVPGPQVPLYAAGARVLEVFPVVPLAPGHGLSIGITSYDGRVFFGLNADRSGVGDVDLLADLVEQELAVLVETAG